MTTSGVRASFKSFDESTKEDWMAIMPQLQVTQSMVADRVLEQLGYLRHDYGGFPVDRLEHSLQTATTTLHRQRQPQRRRRSREPNSSPPA